MEILECRWVADRGDRFPSPGALLLGRWAPGRSGAAGSTFRRDRPHRGDRGLEEIKSTLRYSLGGLRLLTGGANGPACTPGSVRGREPRGRSSLSATRCRAAPAAYPGTRRAASSSPVWPCSGRGLPRGSCHHDPGGLLHHPFTLTRAVKRGRSALCGTVSRIAPGGRYPPSCPVEPGPSSAGPKARRGRPAGSSAVPRGYATADARRVP